MPKPPADRSPVTVSTRLARLLADAHWWARALAVVAVVLAVLYLIDTFTLATGIFLIERSPQPLAVVMQAGIKVLFYVALSLPLWLYARGLGEFLRTGDVALLGGVFRGQRLFSVVICGALVLAFAAHLVVQLAISLAGDPLVR